MLITIFALFGDDIKVITCDKSADIYFDVVSLIALGVFSIEISKHTNNTCSIRNNVQTRLFI